MRRIGFLELKLEKVVSQRDYNVSDARELAGYIDGRCDFWPDHDTFVRIKAKYDNGELVIELPYLDPKTGPARHVIISTEGNVSKKAINKLSDIISSYSNYYAGRHYHLMQRLLLA